jgi:hypothetical protein
MKDATKKQLPGLANDKALSAKKTVTLKAAGKKPRGLMVRGGPVPPAAERKQPKRSQM